MIGISSFYSGRNDLICNLLNLIRSIHIYILTAILFYKFSDGILFTLIRISIVFI